MRGDPGLTGLLLKICFLCKLTFHDLPNLIGTRWLVCLVLAVLNSVVLIFAELAY